MVENIQQRLRDIEAQEQVRIIAAVESGSRAWGFASPDSDYDVRFIYVRREADYLRLKPFRDVLEWLVDGVFDFSGWDLQKALRLLHGSNPGLQEWCMSPIVYRDSDAFDELRSLARTCYIPKKKSLGHYLSMAQTNWHHHFEKPRADRRLKRYFYVLRPVLAARWVVAHETQPPMLFGELMEAELEPGLHPVVQKLLAVKQEAPETEMISPVHVLEDYLQGELDMLGKVFPQLPDRDVDWAPLDRFFCNVVCGNEPDCVPSQSGNR